MRRVLVVLALVAALPAAAQQPAGPPEKPEAVPDDGRDRITIGIAGGIAPRYEGADSSRFRPGGLLQGSIGGYSFAARGTNLFVDLIREAPRAKVDVVLGPVLQLRLERTKASQIGDAQVAALGSIRPAFEIGGYAGLGVSGLTNPYDKLAFDVTYRRDVSGIHRSAIVTPSVSFATPLSRRTLVLASASADHVGAGYGQTYFGVTPAGSAASGLRAYAIGDAGWKSAGGTLLAAHSLSRDIRRGFSVFALGGYSELLGKYRRSPIVQDAGQAGQWFGFAGLAYSF